MSELIDLTAVRLMMLSPKRGGTNFEIIQDTTVGSFRLTQEWTRVADKVMANLQMVNSYFQGRLPAPKGNAQDTEGFYTGHQVFSQILPPGFFLEMRNKEGNPTFVIRSGQIEKGTVSKGVFHNTSEGIMPVLFHDYGPREAVRFCDNVQRTICRWLLSGGFSVGISDLIVDGETQARLTAAIDRMEADAIAKLEAMRNGTLENTSIFSDEDFIESEVRNLLNESIRVTNAETKNLSNRTNRMMNMVRSGAKGKDLNVAQMIGCLGQQNVDGKRVGYGFTDRTLPHFSKFDDSPEARGFIKSSFISGLSPTEVFFHAMAGREGLIDTAVKTSDTGYTQRRLIKAMEDCKVYYDQTVRTTTGGIVQFLYGEDGVDGTKIEVQPVPIASMDLVDMEATYHLRPDGTPPLEAFLTEAARKELAASKGWPARADAHYQQLLDDRIFLITKVFAGRREDQISFPIPFDRLIRTARAQLDATGLAGLPTDLTPGYVLDAIDLLIKDLRTRYGNPDQGTRFLHMLLRMNLSPKRWIMEYRLPRAAFDEMVVRIRRAFLEAIVHPGEMVGIVAAQTIGENATQLVLDSFHSSGTVAAVKATSGVPRFKELLSVSKNIKTPILTIYLRPDISRVEDYNMDADGMIQDARVDEARARSIRVMNTFEMARLSDILLETTIIWDPPGDDGYQTALPEDEGLMKAYQAFAGANPTNCRSNHPWLLRMRFDRERMRQASLTMIDVYLRIYQTYDQTIDCVFTDDNAGDLVARMRLRAEDASTEVDPEDALAALKAVEYNLTHNVLLKGIRGIKKASTNVKKLMEYNPRRDEFVRVAECVIDTDGTNLMDVLANPNVDQVRTVSNDVWEIYHMFGIEAARNALMAETNAIDKPLDYRHQSLLLDTMCNRGTLMSIDRHGINRGDTGPLAKCSFEESTDMLVNASIFSEYDRINGVSANIMLGQLPPCGTGDVEIVLDEARMAELMEGRPAPAALEPLVAAEEVATPMDPCVPENFAFDLHFPDPVKRDLPTI